MLGIPIDGSASVFSTNMSVVMNTTRSESTLKKEHNAIAYHSVCKAVAAGIIPITKMPTEMNLADMLTKPLHGPRLRELCQIVYIDKYFDDCLVFLTEVFLHDNGRVIK